ncbi:unnamed protein product, partial [Ectocarpus sp. 12 AP-2014]
AISNLLPPHQRHRLPRCRHAQAHCPCFCCVSLTLPSLVTFSFSPTCSLLTLASVGATRPAPFKREEQQTCLTHVLGQNAQPTILKNPPAPGELRENLPRALAHPFATTSDC